MAEWQSVTVRFDIFEPLRPPVQSLLQAVEAVEAILEALLGLLKPFFLDLLNPLRALVELLLAALRALINQIRSTGFAVLLVHPDFSQPDFAGVLHSVSGAYPGFEAKVVGKFYDTADLFRPQYPPGSSVAMLVFYVGADSPGDLLGLLFALLALLKHPLDLSGLPAPVDVKALPVFDGTSSISQFRNLFDRSLDQALQLEWRMPQSPTGLAAPGFAGQFVSFYNQFRFPNFIVERTGPFPQDDPNNQLDPRGEVVRIPVSTQTQGEGSVDGILVRYDFPAVNSRATLREEDGSTHRSFPVKIPIQFGSDGEAEAGVSQGSPDGVEQVTTRVTGIATGTYKYLDDDPSLVPGKTYYYRIRAFFGDATQYVESNADSLSEKGSPLVVTAGNQKILRLQPGLTLSRPSRVVKGIVPRPITGERAFVSYTDVFRAIQAGVLLNFELPATFPDNPDVTNSVERNEQRTGWGTLGMLGGQMGPLKAALTNSVDLRSNLVFQSVCRRLANNAATVLFSTPSLNDLLAAQWTTDGVQEVVERVLPELEDFQGFWQFPVILGGITSGTAGVINEYLARESGYSRGSELTGPVPLTNTGSVFATVEERLALANFVRTALSTVSSQTSYLSWYSLTVGDLFPPLNPLLFDFDQFLKALLKAFESALKEIEDIIETLLQKVRALAQLLRTIDEILSILNVNITASILATSTTNGSAESLVQDIIASEDKPGDSPFGLHSGMVLTFGGPGEGAVAAFRAITFILGLPF